MHVKSEILYVFKKFLVLVETQFSEKIKILRSNSSGEYVAHNFQSFLQNQRIISHQTCPYTPQQNRVAERKNRHIDVVRTLRLESSVSSRFWVKALTTAFHLINHLPSPQLQNQSPYFCLFAIHQSFDHLRTFGCVYFIHLPPLEHNKLSLNLLSVPA